MTDEMTAAQNRSVDERVTHMEGVVDSIRSDLTGVKTDLAMLVGEIRPLAARLNQPAKEVPWPGIIASVISIMLLFGTIGWSNLAPIEKHTDIVAARQVALEDFIRDQAITQAEIEARQKLIIQERLARIKE